MIAATAALSATTFTVRVADANGATATATFALTVNGSVSATQAVATKVLTKDASYTAFTPVTASGGTTPLTFTLRNAGNSADATLPARSEEHTSELQSH